MAQDTQTDKHGEGGMTVDTNGFLLLPYSYPLSFFFLRFNSALKLMGLVPLQNLCAKQYQVLVAYSSLFLSIDQKP